MVQLAAPIDAVLHDIASAGSPLSSSALYAAVAKHFRAVAISAEQSKINLILAAWNRSREVPSLTVDEIVAHVSARRDAVQSLDVVYHASVFVDAAAAGPLRAQFAHSGLREWWGRWTRTPAGVRRLAAPTLQVLLDTSPVEDLIAAGCDAEGTWVLAGDGAMRHAIAPGCDGALVLGIEGPWMGTSMLATGAEAGLAVVPGHDLADHLESLPAGTAVVEGVGGDLVRLRVGWTSPLFVWFDSKTVTVQRMERRWFESGHAMRLVIEPSDMVMTDAGVDIPRVVRVRQYLDGSDGGLSERPLLDVRLHALAVKAFSTDVWMDVGSP